MAGTTEKDTAVEALNEIGEYFAAGFFEDGVPESAQAMELPPLMRVAKGIRNHLARCPLPPYGGEWFYPFCGDVWSCGEAVWHHYVRFGHSAAAIDEKRKKASTDAQRAALDALGAFWSTFPPAGGYTHSIPHYDRVLAEGLDGFERRIRAGLQRARRLGEDEKVRLYESLLVVIEGVRILHGRFIGQVESAHLSDPEQETRRRRLLSALRRVPFEPATGFHDAMVAVHFIYVLDGNDNLGRFDQFMRPFFEADRKAGRLGRDEALDMIRATWTHMDRSTGWNAAIGGTAAGGEQGASELTILCIEAARGRRRPNLALRLREDTPQEIWDAALDCIATGAGLPALYGEQNYFRALREAHLGIREDDLPWFAFGGCTETMVHGRSNVGSLDAHFNIPVRFVDVLHRELASCGTFDEFLARFKTHLREEVRRFTDDISSWQANKARYFPQLIRTLLIDDCIDQGREYAAGGARYNWSVNNVEGIANIVDSLCALREVVFENREITAAELLAVLRDDFKGREALRKRLEKCPRYGNGDERADSLAREFSEFIFHEFMSRAPWRGGRFLPACLMFVTYADAGKPVGATPDGRRAGTPIADSAGAYQGRDRRGPTALLRSVTSLDLVHAPGTMVVNIRISKKLLSTPDERERLKDLIRTYFRMGGMQIQINVVDQAVLRDAFEHPERHEDLIIRVGGYSEYWSRLSRDLQLSILERTEHG